MPNTTKKTPVKTTKPMMESKRVVLTKDEFTKMVHDEEEIFISIDKWLTRLSKELEDKQKNLAEACYYIYDQIENKNDVETEVLTIMLSLFAIFGKK